MVVEGTPDEQFVKEVLEIVMFVSSVANAPPTALEWQCVQRELKKRMEEE